MSESIGNPELFHLQILRSADEYGKAPALTDAETGEIIDYTTLKNRSILLAQKLKAEYGLRKGDMLLCFMANGIDYPVIFLAGALIGCPLTGISPDFSKDEVLFYIEKTHAKAIFTTSELIDNVVQKSAYLEIPLFVLGKLAGQMGIDLEKIFEEAKENISNNSEFLSMSSDICIDDVLLAPLSGGTTGTPKCVMLTHKNFDAATRILKGQLFDELSERGGHRTTIALLPFYHASGFWALCYCLLAGHHSVVMRKFQAPLFLSSIEDYKIDTLNVVPSIVTFLLKNYEHCSHGTESNKRIFGQIFTFSGYGMTEVVVLSHMTPIDLPLSNEKHLSSCGKLLPGFECKIINTETGEEITESGAQGELWLKSDCVMKGYLSDEKETRAALDSDGWLHTGDVVSRDADGFYYVVGRLRNMIKVNGVQVSPVELESILLSHEDVLEAAVIGIPDESRGEVPKAFLVLKVVNNIAQKIEEIREFLHGQVAPFKQLHGGITTLTSLPKTASGKVSRSLLKKFAHEEECSETIL
ncbi:AMP-binding enzyme domain-containing protein [Ditylenchus destructor]|nr:AMP-binding enzyme domain-containing protein [Ditylenchus destructor]